MSFLSQIIAKIKVDDNGCWIWQGSKSTYGYGRLRLEGKTISAHRAVLMHVSDTRPDKTIFACHSCDVPACVNPDHLWWGTRWDNIADMVSKGRAPVKLHPEMKQGVRHHDAVLTNAEVKAIRRMAAFGKHTQHQMAEKFGVAQSAICNIVNRKRWKHI